jgi:hypothetical protein
MSLALALAKKTTQDQRHKAAMATRPMVSLEHWLKAYHENAGKWICPVCARNSCFDVCWMTPPCKS